MTEKVHARLSFLWDNQHSLTFKRVPAGVTAMFKGFPIHLDESLPAGIWAQVFNEKGKLLGQVMAPSHTAFPHAHCASSRQTSDASILRARH